MNYYPLLKPFLLAGFFIKEQLKEPVSLFWVVVSPVVTFYLLNYARAPVGGCLLIMFQVRLGSTLLFLRVLPCLASRSTSSGAGRAGFYGHLCIHARPRRFLSLGSF